MQLAVEEHQAAGHPEDRLLGAVGELRRGGGAGGRRRLRVAGDGADRPLQLLLGDPDDLGGMQVAWAKARTAVSSPTNSTVLVRSCSESPGVRQEVQS